MTKTCTKCNKSKRVKEFYLIKGKPMGACKLCHKAACSRRYTTAKARVQMLKQFYSLTLEEFEALLNAQDRRCAICGTSDPGTRGFFVDHDHNCCPGAKSCGQCIRGLLCSSCNLGLGHFKDDPKRLQTALRYLQAS